MKGAHLFIVAHHGGRYALSLGLLILILILILIEEGRSD